MGRDSEYSEIITCTMYESHNVQDLQRFRAMRVQVRCTKQEAAKPGLLARACRRTGRGVTIALARRLPHEPSQMLRKTGNLYLKVEHVRDFLTHGVRICLGNAASCGQGIEGLGRHVDERRA